MKPMLRITSLLFFSAILLTSCHKEIIVPVVADPVSGAWILTDAAESDGYNWRPVSTGFESGVFDFYSNGSAAYTDAGLTMQGNWLVSTANGGYYDQYGDYYTNTHQSMQVQLSDPRAQATLNLYFDEVLFEGNRFVATYYDHGFVVRYWFSRYQ